MSLKILDAGNAYGAALSRASFGGAETAAPASGFADLVKGSFENAVAASRESEAVAAKALNKQADLVDLVSAVNNAELALDTVVSIRDRMISAYQEVMRMPI